MQLILLVCQAKIKMSPLLKINIAFRRCKPEAILFEPYSGKEIAL
jgi:hypothetical protein